MNNHMKVKIDGVEWSQYFVSTETCIKKILNNIIEKKNNKGIKKITLEIKK